MKNWTCKDGRDLQLIRPDELKGIPDGTALYAIDGEKKVVGKDEFDDDTRMGFLAYGFDVTDWEAKYNEVAGMSSIRGKVVATELGDDGTRVTVRVESRGIEYLKFFGKATLLSDVTLSVADPTRNFSKREGVL